MSEMKRELFCYRPGASGRDIYRKKQESEQQEVEQCRLEEELQEQLAQANDTILVRREY